MKHSRRGWPSPPAGILLTVHGGGDDERVQLRLMMDLIEVRGCLIGIAGPVGKIDE